MIKLIGGNTLTKYWLIISLSLATAGTGTALTDLRTAGHALPGAELVGEGRSRILFWHVFDATLHAPHGSWSDEQPFALSLAFHHDLNSERIVEKSIEQMRRLGADHETRLALWSREMASILPDVNLGTTITGVVGEDGHTRLFENGKPIGVIHDGEFGKRFLDVWQGEQASLPMLRTQLLGETAS